MYCGRKFTYINPKPNPWKSLVPVALKLYCCLYLDTLTTLYNGKIIISNKVTLKRKIIINSDPNKVHRMTRQIHFAKAFIHSSKTIRFSGLGMGVMNVTCT
jgi:hypothetical protein